MTKKTTAYWKIKPTPSNYIFYGVSGRNVIDEEYGYIENEIDITINQDGALAMSTDGGEQFIYFYPNQLNHLIQAVKMAQKQAKQVK